MTAINHVATATSKGFMPTTNKSVLVYGEYKGFTLPQGKKYRPTNINKVNSYLAIAIENSHKCHSFELYDEDFLKDWEKFKGKVKKIDPTARSLKVGLISHIKLVVFTKMTVEEVINILENHTDIDDVALQCSIPNVAENACEAAEIAYELAEHYLVPKRAKKDKQMTGNDLTVEEKAMSVVFELKPTIIRRS